MKEGYTQYLDQIDMSSSAGAQLTLTLEDGGQIRRLKVNENRVKAFLNDHPEFEPDMDDRWLPEALRPWFHDGMVQILPHRDGLEGFFIARMVRKGV